jgi:hypothetical protein
MSVAGTVALALALQLPRAAARMAITEMWPMSNECQGPADYKFVHDLDTCINVAAPTSRRYADSRSLVHFSMAIMDK